MRQTSRVIPPIVGIAKVPSISLALVAFDGGDLSSQDAVAGRELTALVGRASPGAPTSAQPLDGEVRTVKFSDQFHVHDISRRWTP